MNKAKKTRVSADAHELDWASIREIASSLPENSDARAIIECFDKARTKKTFREVLDSATFLKLEYTYGEQIVEAGRFQPPLAFQDRSRLAAYTGRRIPFAFALDKPIEVYFEELPSEARGQETKPLKTDGPVFPHPLPSRVFELGDVFGLFELVDKITKYRTENVLYSLSAGERTIYIGAPLTSDEVRDAFMEARLELKPDGGEFRWKYWHPTWMLVKEFMPSDWKCSIVLVPDSIWEAAEAIPSVINPLLLAHAGQLRQVFTEFNEQILLRTLARKGAVLYHEEISYLLGVLRGRVPAMVPWHRSRYPLPLDRLLRPLSAHLRKRPTNHRRGHIPFALVPRHLKKGESGYFSCKWNIGPAVTQDDAPRHAIIVDDLLNACSQRLLTADDCAGLFRPFVLADRLKSLKLRFKEQQCVEIDVKDLVGVPPGEAPSEELLRQMEKPATEVLSTRGFLSAGFLIKRPQWL